MLVHVVAYAADDEPPRDATYQPHQWGAITLFHGLPSERVRAIAQDREGVLWFGTEGGLARYDGRRTQAVSALEFPSANVRALATDRRGVLWVGTTTGALRRTGEVFQIIEATRGRDVTAITHTRDGRTLLASAGVILECRTGTNDSVNIVELATTANGDAVAPQVTSIAQDEQGALLVGTLGRGVLRLGDGEVSEVISRPRAYFVEAMVGDASGAVWFGAQTSDAGAGLFKARTTGKSVGIERFDLPTGTVRAMRFDAAGDLWIGTAERGVFRRGADGRVARWTFEATAGGLLSNEVNAIFFDREGVVWFGTSRGVCRYDPGAMQGETISADADENFVRVLYRTTTGAVLCGTNNGLFRRDAASGKWHPVADIGDAVVHAMGEEAQGRLLVGTARGLFIERDAGERYAQFESFSASTGEIDKRSVRAIERFRGQVYLGVYGAGVERVEGSRRISIPFGDEAEGVREVTSLRAEGERRLWVGTARAGVRFIETDVMHADGALDDLRARAVWDIEARDGALWFATSDGLFRFRENGLRAIVAGVDVRDVYLVDATGETEAARDAQQAWCATDGAGLLTLRVTAGDEIVTSRFGVEHGLPTANAFALVGLEANDGASPPSLLVGTNRGAVRYIPSRVAPLLRLARFGNDIIAAGSAPPATAAALRLAYPQRDLALDITAASTRTFPEQFRYRFQLREQAGKSVAARTTSEPRFAVDNLAPGSYEIEAQAYSSDLLASAPLLLKVEVERAPYPLATIGLSLLLALTLGALLWGTMQNRRIRRASHSLTHANRELATARLALATEAETERRRIARDLHDQTLADLRRLILLSDELTTSDEASHKVATRAGSSGSKLDATSLRREVESISTEVRRICEDLSPSVLETVGFAAALEWAITQSIEQLPASEKFAYKFICDDEFDSRLRLARPRQIQIYRIMQEALSNIGRHAAASEILLTARITNDDETLKLQLEDDGHGFDAGVARALSGRGLTNMRARAVLVGARVEWTPREGGGTVFTVDVANAG